VRQNIVAHHFNYNHLQNATDIRQLYKGLIRQAFVVSSDWVGISVIPFTEEGVLQSYNFRFSRLIGYPFGEENIVM
jgi:hypothetical protein